MRNLFIVLGDQLDADSAAFDGFDPDCDSVLQMEVMVGAALDGHPYRKTPAELRATRSQADEITAVLL